MKLPFLLIACNSATVLGCLLISQIPILAQEGITSGPEKGTSLTAIRCFATHGRHAGEEFDAADDLGKAPSAILFIHELTRNTAPVIRALDEMAADYGVLGFRSHTVALSGDRTAGEDLLRRVNGSLNLSNPIILSLDGAEGPGNYGLSRKPTLTFVFAKDGVVEQSIALTDTGPNDVPKVKEWIEGVAGALPDDDGELLALIKKNLPADESALRDHAVHQALELRHLRQQLRQREQQQGGAGATAGGAMQRGDHPATQSEKEDAPPQPDAPGEKPPRKREGSPPDDGALQTLLRSYIRKTNGDGKVDDLFAEIKARAAESEDLHGQTIEMFKLMLSFRDNYGTQHAQQLAEGFLKAETSNAAAEQ